MRKNLTVLGLIGILAGVISYHVYQLSGILSSLTVLVFTAWVLFNLKSKMSVLNSVGTLLNPFISFFNIYLLSFTYYALQGLQFYPAMYRALGWALLGTAFSMLLYKYWNI